MEERGGWRDSFGTAWGNLTGVNNDGNVRAVRLVFFLIFLLGTAWAGYSYMQALEVIRLEQAFPAPGPNVAKADEARLNAMIQQVRVTSERRAESGRTVETLEKFVARYPFREPVLEPEIADPTRTAAAVVVEVPVVYIDYPPEIVLRGIMQMGRQHVAVMDIAGVGTGMVVKAGDTFMQRKGRVVRIAPDKVVVSWGGRNWDIAPRF